MKIAKDPNSLEGKSKYIYIKKTEQWMEEKKNRKKEITHTHTHTPMKTALSRTHTHTQTQNTLQHLVSI